MQIKNVEIRKNIENNNLKFWQIAEALNINDGNFSRLLRKELPKDKKEKILKIIEDLKKEENDGNK